MQAEPELTAWLWATPNSNRVLILFEELGLAYRAGGFCYVGRHHHRAAKHGHRGRTAGQLRAGRHGLSRTRC
jgi:hypothetical protein